MPLSRRHAIASALALPALATAFTSAGRALAQGATPPAASPGTGRTLSISAIPDQDVAVLNRQFGAMTLWLGKATGLTVAYVPMVDYASLVTAFVRNDVQLAWFGGLTGVQARARAEGAAAFAQRPRDADFHSRFIVRADLPVKALADLKGLSFTFGSESSTSGHLMPRYFLLQAGVDPERDFRGLPNYSGSHDKTIALVQSGAYDAGALNEAVWEQRVAEGKVDTATVRDFFTTPAFFDYNWTIRGDADQTFGAGAGDRIVRAILGMTPSDPEQKAILDLFQTDKFVPTENKNYAQIQEVAEKLGILRS